MNADFQDSVRGHMQTHNQRREFPLWWPGVQPEPLHWGSVQGEYPCIHLQDQCDVHLGVQEQYSYYSHLCVLSVYLILSMEEQPSTASRQQREVQQLREQAQGHLAEDLR